MTSRTLNTIALQANGQVLLTHTVVTADGFVLSDQRWSAADADLTAFAQTRQKQTWDELDCAAYMDLQRPLTDVVTQAVVVTAWEGTLLAEAAAAAEAAAVAGLTTQA